MIYDVKPIIDQFKDEIKQSVNQLSVSPSLIIVKSTSDFASEKYINNKVKMGKELGINVDVTDVSQLNTYQVVESINKLAKVYDGIIVQLPLHEGLNESAIINNIPSNIDVDGFSAEHINNIFHSGQSNLEPCTPHGVMKIVEKFCGEHSKRFVSKYINLHEKLSVQGKNIVIINRSNIVGKPLALMLINAGATVTVCNSKTVDLQTHLMNADVVITAVGKPNFIKSDMVKNGCLVIDISINRQQDGKVCGDCDREMETNPNVYVTRVPGSVGPMTVLSLMNNVVRSANTKKWANCWQNVV